MITGNVSRWALNLPLLGNPRKLVRFNASRGACTCWVDAACLQKEGSPEGRRNPSQVGRWVVHQLPAMIDSFKINELITEALRLYDKIPPHRLMADGLMLPVVSSFYTFPYVWMDQPIRIDRILAVNGKKCAPSHLNCFTIWFYAPRLPLAMLSLRGQQLMK